MKAEIVELWDTGIDILCFASETNGEDSDTISSLSDLRKCDNILVGDKDGFGGTEVLMGNNLLNVHFRKVSHPSGAGTLYICEL